MDELEKLDLEVEYTVEGHTSRDVAFDILQTARDEGSKFIVMGYPDKHYELAEEVEHKAPCDVIYANGVRDDEDMRTINVGAGGGPHHEALLPLVDTLSERGSQINLISVTPEQEGETHEDPDETLSQLSNPDSINVQEVSAPSVAEGLVSTAAENGGVLLIGATRTRSFRRWLFGSTPDRVIELGEDADVPVLIYASSSGVADRIEDRLFPVYRYFKKLSAGNREWPNNPYGSRSEG